MNSIFATYYNRQTNLRKINIIKLYNTCNYLYMV